MCPSKHLLTQLQHPCVMSFQSTEISTRLQNSRTYYLMRWVAELQNEKLTPAAMFASIQYCQSSSTLSLKLTSMATKAVK